MIAPKTSGATRAATAPVRRRSRGPAGATPLPQGGRSGLLSGHRGAPVRDEKRRRTAHAKSPEPAPRASEEPSQCRSRYMTTSTPARIASDDAGSWISTPSTPSRTMSRAPPRGERDHRRARRERLDHRDPEVLLADVDEARGAARAGRASSSRDSQPSSSTFGGSVARSSPRAGRRRPSSAGTAGRGTPRRRLQRPLVRDEPVDPEEAVAAPSRASGRSRRRRPADGSPRRRARRSARIRSRDRRRDRDEAVRALRRRAVAPPQPPRSARSPTPRRPRTPRSSVSGSHA